MGDSIALYRQGEKILRRLARLERMMATLATRADLDAAKQTLADVVNDESDEIQHFIVLTDDQRKALQASLDAANAEIEELKKNQISDADVADLTTLRDNVEALLNDPRTPIEPPA